MQVMNTAEVGDLNLFRRGKVRDTFQLADGTLLMIATDRLSVFDVVLPTAIPGKGTVLTQMSRWWFAETAGIMPNHLLPDLEEAIPSRCAVTGCHARCTSLAPSASMSNVWCADSSADRGGRSTATRARSQASRCTKGSRDSSRLPSPRFTPGDQEG